MGLDKESSWTLHCSSNMLPEKIGDYKILDSLGSGTFGDVYKVEKEGEVFALKHIVLGSKTDRVVIQLEIDSHGSLPEHENIVRLVHSFKSWYRWNIVLEYCELGTLEHYVKSRKPDIEVIKSFMYDMASGLHHLHSNNIVHRDIKPENILLVQGRSKIPTCKISDFGVARFISMASDGSQPNNGNKNGELYFKTFRGSPLFVAPEVRNGQYTQSCDIFSMGIVFYLMFAREISSDKRLTPWVQGGTPFYRATDAQIRSQLNIHVLDKTLNHLIASMLVIDLHGRISAASLAKELQGKEMSQDEVDTTFKDDVDKTSMDNVDESVGNEIYEDDMCIIPKNDAPLLSNEESSDEECSMSKDDVCLPSKLEADVLHKASSFTDVMAASFKDVTASSFKDVAVQSSMDSTSTPSKDEMAASSKDKKSTSSKDKTSTSSKDKKSTSSKAEVFISSEDEVFLAACVLVAIVLMMVWLPFPLFVLCMAISLVAGWEFLPKSTLENITLLT